MGSSNRKKLGACLVTVKGEPDLSVLNVKPTEKISLAYVLQKMKSISQDDPFELLRQEVKEAKYSLNNFKLYEWKPSFPNKLFTSLWILQVPNDFKPTEEEHADVLLTLLRKNIGKILHSGVGFLHSIPLGSNSCSQDGSWEMLNEVVYLAWTMKGLREWVLCASGMQLNRLKKLFGGIIFLSFCFYFACSSSAHDVSPFPFSFLFLTF